MNAERTLSESEVLELVKDAMRESVRDPAVPVDAISMDRTLSSLGVDSVAAIEMGAYIEEKLGVRLPDDQLARVHSVRDLVALLQRHARVAA